MKNRWTVIASGIVVCATLAFFARTAVAQVQDSSRQLQQIEPVTTWPGKAKRWALVIGVDKYSDPQISPLRGADNDARTLSDALVRFAGFPQDQVILLATDQPAERQPTRINILRRLSNLASVVPKDGLLLISFAGHGIERRGQAYLIPSDSQISDDINLLEESAVSVARMKDRIRATGVGQVVILLDACRNDPGGRADAPNPLTNAYVNAFNFDVRNHEVAAFATIYATAVGQRAYEYTEKKQGYFTWAIVEGLKGAAANDKGEVTLASLISYVQETVPKRVAIDLGGGKQQRPFSQMEGYKADELVMAVSNPMLANASPPSAPTSVDPTAFELSYWETIKNSNNPDDFGSYLEKYPDGQFVTLAKNRLASLQPNKASETGSARIDQAEMTFWDSIKASSNPDDFRAYLAKFPQGTFGELANNRLKILGSANRSVVITREPKTFKGLYGRTLSVSPTKIEIVDRDGKGDEFNCSAFANTRVGTVGKIPSVQPFACPKYGSCKFDTFTEADAASALNYIHAVCNSPTPPITVAETTGGDPLGGTTWRGTSPGRDKQYEFVFLSTGGMSVQTTVGKYNFLEKGTWQRTGTGLSIDVLLLDGKCCMHADATVTGDTMNGSWDKGKYKFNLTKVQ